MKFDIGVSLFANNYLTFPHARAEHAERRTVPPLARDIIHLRPSRERVLVDPARPVDHWRRPSGHESLALRERRLEFEIDADRLVPHHLGAGEMRHHLAGGSRCEVMGIRDGTGDRQRDEDIHATNYLLARRIHHGQAY